MIAIANCTIRSVELILCFFEEIKRNYLKHLAYKSTVRELNKLTDAELRDIGISRGMIHSIAMEAHYDDR
jgi:uncharacterized protein YjiS (DUF1127 family)